MDTSAITYLQVFLQSKGMVQSALVNCYPARYRIAILKENAKKLEMEFHGSKNLLQGAGPVHGTRDVQPQP